MTRKKYPWEEEKLSYQEWSKMDFDWGNYRKATYVSGVYLHYLNNYAKGLGNDHIMKSSFGNKDDFEIKATIKMWFDKCIGSYSEISFK